MASQFWDLGYEVVEDLIEPAHIAMSAKAMDLAFGKGVMRTRDSGYVHGGEDEYGPVVGELLLRHCRPAIEKVVGRELVESYAYWRIYKPGAELLKHKDRPGSEIAVTITIEADPENGIWPIKLEDIKGKEETLVLQPGSGIVYRGHKVPHWRDKLEAGSQKQLMLFYIVKDGKFTDHFYDGRDGDPLTSEPV
ncbi:MAG: hypothetical protein AAGE86_03200 [Pseudomonadota bacterium]